ncbi:MAG TPA: hypothetical protein VK196_00455 [Magnetospirillum sp.]|nr:hypothetical protein [Magnetospirillum sp.]
MDRDEIARAMPGVRNAFEAWKDNLREGRMAQAGAALFGECLNWGEQLRGIYLGEDRETLSTRDPLTRFFVTRYRGMPQPADIGDAPGHALFLMAFTAFPYLDALVEELTVGEYHGAAEGGAFAVRRVLAGEDEGDGAVLPVRKAALGWGFDLMPVYHAKAMALEQFIASRHGGDFDDFLWSYVADHDLMFDRDQAWRPVTER